MYEEPSPPSTNVPEWVVSFGDMMSLLLTFFIMLVSFSEPKKDDKFIAVLDQLQKQFGKDLSGIEILPGGVKARQAAVALGINQGRSRRRIAIDGCETYIGVPANAANPRTSRPGEQTGIGTAVFFGEGGAELDDDARTALRTLLPAIAGKPQKIEIRGHTSQRPEEGSADYADHWDLAYRRSRAVMRYLTEELLVDPQRIRLSVAGPNEPLHLGVDPAKMRENPRVELYLLEETVSDLTGSAEERRGRFAD